MVRFNSYKSALIIFILSLFISVTFAQQQPSNVSPQKLKVIYFKDGEGIFVYDLSTKETKCIYTCKSSSQHFSPERLIYYKDYLIFGMYDSGDGFAKSKEVASSLYEWKENFYIMKKEGGEPEPYSTITYRDKDMYLNEFLIEDYHRKDMPSVFSNFPNELHLIIDVTGGSPQIHALYKNVNGRCVFIAGSKEQGTSGKTIRLWDLKKDKIDIVLEFPNTYLTISHGGGGYDYPYFLNEKEIIFAELPRLRGPFSFLGLYRWYYLKKLNLDTDEVTTIDKLSYSAYPKLSPCGNFVVYGIWDGKTRRKQEIHIYDIWLKEIKSGKSVKIGRGHSPFWLN